MLDREFENGPDTQKDTTYDGDTDPSASAAVSQYRISTKGQFGVVTSASGSVGTSRLSSDLGLGLDLGSRLGFDRC